MRRRDPALLRLLKFEYDECSLCGATDLLHLHHVLYRSHGGDDVRANIICLCLICHEDVHNGRAKGRLAVYVMASRPDTLEYLIDKLGENQVFARFAIHRQGYSL